MKYSNIIHTLFLALACGSFSGSILAQENVTITYDAAGNRVLVNKLIPRTAPVPTLIGNYHYTQGNTLNNTLLNVDLGSSALAHGGPVNTTNLVEFGATVIENIDLALSEHSDQPQGPFTVAPNPSRDLITVSEQKQTDLHYNIILYDPYGKMLEQFMRIQTPFVIDLVKYPAGFYYLRLYSSTTQQTIKIVKSN